MYPKLWAAGLAYPDLIERLIRWDKGGMREKKRNQYSQYQVSVSGFQFLVFSRQKSRYKLETITFTIIVPGSVQDGSVGFREVCVFLRSCPSVLKRLFCFMQV
jgi:hypothetical protein